MNNEQTSTIAELARQVRDESKSLDARRTALKHIAALGGESTTLVDTVTENELCAVVSGMATWSAIDSRLRDLTLVDSLEALREGRMRRDAVNRR